MNDIKKIDLLRKRNSQMQEEIDKLKEINKKYENIPENQCASEIINELENIRQQWINVLEEITTERNEYKKLNKDLRKMLKLHLFTK